MNRRNLTILTALAGLAIVAFVVATASGSGSDADQGAQVRVDHDPAPNAVDPATKAKFGVLRRAAAAGDTVDMGQSSGMMAAEHGMALDLARKLPAGGGSRAWVVPAADGVCLLVRSPGSIGPGGGCGNSDELTSQGTYVVSGPGKGSGDAVEVFGLAPDGVGSVRLSYGDGSSETVPVSGNGYYARGSRAPAKIAFTGPGGPVTLPRD